jgi:DNA-binding transcriptional LysR family regulator
MPLRLEQLRYFATVAEEGQITRAARRLHIAQPALSQAISQLEAELGIELLERHPRGVTLTPSGERFLEKASAALAATNEAAATAESLARAAVRALDVGFIGPPPTFSAPELFARFAAANNDAAITFHELPFPTESTALWLADVDVAFCHAPAPDRGVMFQPVRHEPRALVAPESHPLAQRKEVSFRDVLNEEFISYHPTVQASWAGFHSLDDHRGKPPLRLSTDFVRTAAEMLKSMARRRAITTIPACDAAIVESTLRGVVAIPVADAEPMLMSLLWRTDHTSPLVDALVASARALGDGRPAVERHSP